MDRETSPHGVGIPKLLAIDADWSGNHARNDPSSDELVYVNQTSYNLVPLILVILVHSIGSLFQQYKFESLCHQQNSPADRYLEKFAGCMAIPPCGDAVDPVDPAPLFPSQSR